MVLYFLLVCLFLPIIGKYAPAAQEFFENLGTLALVVPCIFIAGVALVNISFSIACALFSIPAAVLIVPRPNTKKLASLLKLLASLILSPVFLFGALVSFIMLNYNWTFVTEALQQIHKYHVDYHTLFLPFFCVVYLPMNALFVYGQARALATEREEPHAHVE